MIVLANNPVQALPAGATHSGQTQRREPQHERSRREVSRFTDAPSGPDGALAGSAVESTS